MQMSKLSYKTAMDLSKVRISEENNCYFEFYIHFALENIEHTFDYVEFLYQRCISYKCTKYKVLKLKRKASVFCIFSEAITSASNL